MPTNVATLAQLKTAVADTGISAIAVTADIDVTSEVTCARSDLTIDCGGHTLTNDCTSTGHKIFVFGSTQVDAGFVGIGQSGSPSRGSSLVTGTITAAGTTLQMHDEVQTLSPGDIVSIACGVNTSDPAEPAITLVMTVSSVTGPVSGTYTINFTAAFGVDVPTYTDADDLKSHVASSNYYKIQPTGSYGQWFNNDGTLTTTPWLTQANFTKGLGTKHGMTTFVGGVMNHNVTLKNGTLHTILPSNPFVVNSDFPLLANDVTGFTLQDFTINNVFGSAFHSTRSHNQTISGITITGTGVASGGGVTFYADGFSSWGGTGQSYSNITWDHTKNINGFSYEVEENDVTISGLTLDTIEFDSTGISNSSGNFIFGLFTANNCAVSNVTFSKKAGTAVTWSGFGQVVSYADIIFESPTEIPATLYVGDVLGAVATEDWTAGDVTIGGHTYTAATTVTKTGGSAITVPAADGTYAWVRMPRGMYLSMRLRLTTVGSCTDIFDPLGNHYSTTLNQWTDSKDKSHSWGTLQANSLWTDYEDGTHGIALSFIGSSAAVIEIEVTYLPIVGYPTSRDWLVVAWPLLTVADDMALPTTNLTAHFDASATTHLKKTQGNPISTSTGTPADGDAVEAWLKETDGSADVELSWASSNVESPNFRSGTPLMLHSCLDFDGTNDDYQFTNDAFSARTISTLMATTAHTIIMAIYPEVISSTGHGENTGHLVLGDASGGYFGLNLYDSSGTKKVYGYIYDGADRIVETPCTASASHVIVWRHTGGNQYISVDGGAEVSGAAGTVGSDVALYLAAGTGGATRYNGRIGEFAIYSDGTAGGALAGAISYFIDKWITIPVVAGTLSQTSVGSTAAALDYATVTSGTLPYSNQLRRSTVSGSGYNDVGSPQVGATASFSDTGLSPSTDYYYIVLTTDNASQTATSNEVHVTTSAAPAVDVQPTRPTSAYMPSFPRIHGIVTKRPMAEKE